MSMMNAFSRYLPVVTDGLGPEAIKKLLAQTAREALAEAQGAGQFPRNYIISVNGRTGASEESVVPPGPIVYYAKWWPEVLTYGVTFAQERSPHKSGRYKSSWFVMVNGNRTAEYESISLDAECIITNNQPYSRRIEVGRQRVNVPPGIVEDLVSALRRRFGDLLNVRRMFINLTNAYVLKTKHPVTYPAAVITMRF